MKRLLGKLNIKWHLAGISAIVFLIPLWIKGTIIDQSDIEIQVYPIFTNPVNIDFFGRSKLNLLSYLIILLALQFIWYYIHRKNIKIQLNTPVLFALGFILSLTIATFLSEYSAVAILGFSDRYEGLYAYAYYVLILFFTYLFIRNYEDIRSILKVMMLGIVPVVFFGMLQAMDIFLIHDKSLEKFWYFGVDPFYQGFIDMYQEYFKDRVVEGYNIVGATLQNANYLSVYSAVMFQLAVGFYFNAMNKKGKVTYFILMLVSFLGSLIAASKTAFFISMFMLVLQLLWRLVAEEKIGYKSLAGLLISLPMVFVMTNTFSNDLIRKEIFGIFASKSVESTSEVLEGQIDPAIAQAQRLEEIVIEPDITYVRDSICEIQLVIDNDHIVVANPDVFDTYSYWRFEDNTEYATLYLRGKALHFGIVENEILVYGPRGLTKDIGQFYEPILDGFLFTYRGYTWSIVLDLVKERPFFGYGPDLLTVYTPIDDIYSRYYYTKGATTIAINPHNMYLQHLFNGGVITFVLFMGIVVSIYLMGFMQYLKYKEKRQMIMLVFFPLSTFLIAGFLNDTIIGTGVILYCLLGIGAFIVKSESKKRPLELAE